jgi:hypothetical protein
VRRGGSATQRIATTAKTAAMTVTSYDERGQAWNIAPEESHSWTYLDSLPMPTNLIVVLTAEVQLNDVRTCWPAVSRAADLLLSGCPQ